MSPPAKVPPLPDASQTVQVTPYNYNTTATVSTPQLRQTILLPDIDWVEIAGGEFIYQQGERRSLPSFGMARYPITNIQYQTFIDAGGYREKRWWTDLERPEPEASHWPQANRPRTNVNWYEAVAFCRWLSAQLGDELRLPTEEEWERAARGRDGWQYPWGNTYESGRANINETWDKMGDWNLQQTTAVGVYPHGTSSEGVLDLSGNVWEWCLNQYDHPEQIEAGTSGRTRVLRGGSWYDSQVVARGSPRNSFHPGSRSFNWGFRLVSSAPIR
jgi:formylglycine-generating enzyme required for sulfatase activity